MTVKQDVLKNIEEFKEHHGRFPFPIGIITVTLQEVGKKIDKLDGMTDCIHCDMRLHDWRKELKKELGIK